VNGMIDQDANRPPDQRAIREKHFHPADTFVEFPKEDIEKSIPHRFEKIASRYPERVAIKTAARSITYKDLNEGADRIAYAILDRVEHPGRVALVIDESADMIAALFGALKAGQAYVPIDPSYPPERVAHMLANSEAELIIGNRRHTSRLEESGNGRYSTFDIEALKPDVSERNVSISRSPDAMAYIMYTSGSTGQPKGVIQNHRNVLEKVMSATNEFRLCIDDRYSLLHSCCTNASVRHIFGALLTGASLYPFEVKGAGIAALTRWLSAERISVYYSFPALFREICHSLDASVEMSVRLVYLAGEPVTKQDVELYRAHFPDHCVLVNLMGSNETGATCQYLIDKQTQIEGTSVPVGYPTSGREVLLINDEGEPVGHNVVGEIAIRSRYLSPGYWRNPELTKSKYKIDEHDGEERIYLTGDVGRMASNGCLYYLGRKDFTTKVRGFRISLTEIEGALCEIHPIKEAAVVVRSEHPEDQRLIAYLTLSERPEPSTSALKRILAGQLPSHMIPSRFVYLEAFPQTPNGKIDRQILPDPGRSRPSLETDFVRPATGVEEKLAQIWCEVLFLEDAGIHDNFFDLGGNSLLLAKMQGKLLEVFGKEIPLVEMFKFPTISALAGYFGPGNVEGDRFETIRLRAMRQKEMLARRRPRPMKPPSGN